MRARSRFEAICYCFRHRPCGPLGLNLNPKRLSMHVRILIGAFAAWVFGGAIAAIIELVRVN